MNTVKIWGGLGNQMFQYAFGCVSGLRTGEEIKYDLSWFYESPNRSYGLGAFNCKVEEIDGRLVRKLTRDKPLLRLFGIRPKLRKTREEPLCIYNPRLLEAKNAAFSGYYQVARYYEEADVRTKLLEDFTLKDIPESVAAISREMMGGGCESVSLHVRRGDYLKLQDAYALCTKEYYEEAVKCICSRVGRPCHVFVFSDDLDWCRESLNLPVEVTFVDLKMPNRPELDMYLMSCCHHNVIANSSFSWWGAYLNRNPDKIVVAPKAWYVNDETDIVPANWIRL